MNKWRTELHNMGNLFQNLNRQVIVLSEIKEPPCKTCFHFSPRYINLGLENSLENGTKLCWSKDQYQDFSCYRDETEGK